ncbi:MAG: amino acid adenylation domain-containing protein [Candidatus Aminicenantes bacterium]|jgi:amino acid adenylation domain-containing protein
MTEILEHNHGTGIEIAIIGIAGRFPGAENIHEFWNNLKNGIESISFSSGEELKEVGMDPQLLEDAHFVRSKGAVLENKASFDARFFDYTPNEAEIMDPQIRIFHECAWEALEDSGYNPDRYDGLIGIYAGASTSSYWEGLTFLGQRRDKVGQFSASQLSNKDFLSARVAYKLNLKGPALTLQTACSTSLAAVHLACQAILDGDCHMALAGGVAISSQPMAGYFYQEGMVRSPDGHCRVFDAQAKGFNSGEGVGVVVLKLLEDAITDRDYVYAIIKGSAINNDGIRKATFTAPSREAQTEVIRKAHRVAEVAPESVSYIETHGTGTYLGDPIEVEALKQAFYTDRKGSCAIGSVKSNIGHLDAASGIAALIKTTLALKYKLIPPTLHFETPNPKIDFENSPFYVISKPKEWKNNNYPLRAGVSSFAIGGTNVHVVLEEWNIERPAEDIPSKSRDYQLILLSAKTQIALDKMTKNLEAYLKNNLLNHGNHENPVNTGLTLADAAYTLQIGRKVFPYRRAFVCSDAVEAGEILSTPTSRKVRTFSSPTGRTPSIVFLFPGLGSQYVNMGREIYRSEPVFRQEMDRCFEILSKIPGGNIKDILYPANVSQTAENKIKQVNISQLVLFVFEYSLAALLMSWGIKPQAMIGYSFGEYAAACLSGVFSLEDALSVVACRAQLMQEVPPGRMLSVPLSREELQPYLAGDISLSIDNGASCVVSGTVDAIEAFAKEVKRKKYFCIPLQADRAVHSAMMDPILKTFKDGIKDITLNTPRIPYISNVTGKWLTHREASDPGYWAMHIRQTVQFSDGIRELLKNPDSVFVEIGPGSELSALMMRYIENNPRHHVVTLVRPKERETSDIYYLLNKIGELWLYGIPVNWSEFYSTEERYRIPLPTYPFESQPYWLEGDPLKIEAEMFSQNRQPEFSDWFSVFSWKRSILPLENEPALPGKQQWLVLVDGCALAAKFVERLKREGNDVVTITPGPGFGKVGNDTYTVNPSRGRDYFAFFDELHSLNRMPDRILHFWGVTEAENENKDPGTRPSTFEWEVFRKAQDLGFYSLLYLAKALAQHHRNSAGTVDISVVTNNMQDFSEDDELYPEKATILGPIKVIPQEHPGITCRSIDIALPKTDIGARKKEKIVDQLWTELSVKSLDTVVAFRGNQRWLQVFEPVRLHEVPEISLPLRKKGVYLITGGLGKIGLIFARYLAEQFNARLILTGRSAVPLEEQCRQRSDTHGDDNSMSQKINHLRELKTLGGEVMVFRADVGNLQQMQQVVRQAEAHFGSINGVIHAAGIVNGNTFKVIRELNKAECQRQFQAKVYGTIILDELFKDKSLDFCWVMSSISTVLGGLEFFAYSAANSFMDTYVHWRNRSNGRPWIIANWDGMEADKTVDAFKRILAAKQFNQVVVANGGNLQQRIQQWVKLESLRDEDENKKEKFSSLNPRPFMSNPYIAPRSSAEQSITEIWQELFGFDKIGVRDSFFELGGDSLKAITVISRIHRKLHVEIPLTEFFKRPTIEALAEYLYHASISRLSVIQPLEKKDYYVLSSAQKRLYLLQQLDKGSIGYNEIKLVLLEGAIEKEKLEDVFRELIRRHEILRTSIQVPGEEPIQKIHETVEVPFEIEGIDLNESVKGHLSVVNGNSEKTEQEKVEHIIQQVARPFNLDSPPFIRVALIKIRADRHVLVLDRHHIITDGVSHQILVKEFMALYQGEELPALTIQYKDYAEWQNRERKKKTIQQQKAFWLKDFEREIPILNLPTDYPRPPVYTYEGSALDFILDKDETAAMKGLAVKENVTLFMMMLSLLYTLLSRLSGQEDIVIGTPVIGRKNMELQSVMGIFINTLALRNYPTVDKTFRGFLLEVKERTLKAFENQDYQFEDLVDQLAVERDTSRNPLFDLMFVFQNQEEPGPEIPGLKIKSYGYSSKISIMDITFNAQEIGERLGFYLEYSPRLFHAETIKKFFDYFKQTVSSVLENPGKRIGEIEIINKEEKHHILYDFNSPNVEYPDDKTLHQLFAQQTTRTLDNIALVEPGPAAYGACSYMSVTYRQLNEKSNQLAGILREKQLKSDQAVGLMTDISIDMVIGMLAILKAGGAFLPIDPDYPRERIKYLVEDSNIPLMLTQKIFMDKAPLEVEAICLAPPSLYKRTASNPGKTNGPHNLVYVIYTSGSTGKPKGVMIQHNNIVNQISGLKRMYPYDGSLNYILLAPFTFDPSVHHIFLPLVSGGKLFLPSKNTKGDALELLDFIVSKQVDIVDTVPSMMEALLDHADGFKSLDFKYIVLAGDVFSKELHAKIKENVSPLCTVINIYGPTEATINATLYECSDEEIHSCIPIGCPLINYKILILNDTRGLLPIGVPGEICIGGLGVARGYVNRPELTEDKFIKNPFLKGDILYITGDLGRWLPDGNIEFLGRKDYQVKIGGSRIEPAEIESYLKKKEGISDAIVVAKEDNKGDKYLCAYFVPEMNITGPGLSEYLAKAFPSHMIPSYFIPIDRIPLTAHGKVDRKALPEPGIQKNEEHAVPTNNIEEKMVEIWSEVLGIETDLIGIDTDFFLLGGHSLKTMKLVSRIHKVLNTKVPLVEVFRTPTVRELSKYIKSAARGEYSAIRVVEKKEYYPLSSAQKRLYVIHQLHLDSTNYNMSQAFFLNDIPDKEKLEAVLRRLINRHESLRTSFEMVKGEPVQRIHKEVNVNIEYFKSGFEASGKKVETIIRDYIRPFDLSLAPLLRMVVLENGKECMVIVDMHHIVSDGISKNLLVRDFQSIYAEEKLPLLRLQYKDYSEWQYKTNRNGNHAIKRQEDYWLKELAGKIPEINLPIDYAKPGIQDFEGNAIRFSIHNRTTQRLKELASEEGVTLYMVILAIYNVLLSKVCGQEDIIIGTGVTNRVHIDLERIVGMFVNMIVLRNYPKAGKTFKAFLEEVKRRTVDAFDNQNYQFEHLVEKLGKAGYGKSNPIVNVGFELEDNGSQQEVKNLEEILGIDMEKKYQGRTSKLDLALVGEEVGEKLVFSFEYRTKLFKKETIERLSTYFQEIVSSVVDNKIIHLRDIKISHELEDSQADNLQIDFGF